ncbi:AAA family ATPase, partial [Candidatus Woesearchaeota archaeon]|nr:AAA family ATPase [Candidatus Woesearchaeota archaeon]
MSKTIIVTGTPGTGKTTVAKSIAKETGWKYVDVNKVIKDRGLSEGKDLERDCNIVDEEKLAETLGKMMDSSDDVLVIDSHMSHHIQKSKVDVCLVTKCKLKELEQRLKKREYSEDKIKENLECEILDVCLNEAEENGHKVIVVETDKKIEIKKILKKIDELMRKN